MSLPAVSSFWTGRPLSFLEQLCLKSFADLGHPTRLYSYDAKLQVPDGVELADAREIVPDMSRIHAYNGFAPFSDVFRLNMLAKTDEIWVDCDVVALKPMPDRPFIFYKERRNYSNAVLRLPKDSASLTWLLSFVNAERPWLPADWPFLGQMAQLAKTAEVDGDRLLFQPQDMKLFPYMTYGPLAMTYVLERTGEVRHEMSSDLFSPVHPVMLRRNYFRPRMAQFTLPDECVAVHHIGGNAFKEKFDRMAEFVPPRRNSFIGRLCRKHGIDPMSAPIVVAQGAPT